MRKEGGWELYHSIGFPLSYSRGNFQKNLCRPHPVRGIKPLSEPCFYYLQTILDSQYRYCVWLLHTFHIVNLIETSVLYILLVI
jgi:hypothetical protein